MRRIILDTNVLLDYFGVCCSDADHGIALELIAEIMRRSDGFLVTPTTLKDFEYLLSAQLKREVRDQKGSVSAHDAAAIFAVSQSALETLADLSCVISLGEADCAMARVLCNTHADYEDNLIVAAALRLEDACIVTRDRKLLAHCPVACMNPSDCLAGMRAGIFG